MKIHVLLQAPTFPPDSCVRADNITWNYNFSINMTGFSPVVFEEEEAMLHNVELDTYEVVVNPIATELGLSGNRTSSIIGPSQERYM